MGGLKGDKIFPPLPKKDLSVVAVLGLMEPKELRVAAAQISPAPMDKEANLLKVARFMEEAVKGESARLTVFPECALTGYALRSLKEVKEAAEPIPGPSTKELEKLCKRLNSWLVVGLVEESSGAYYNAAILIGPRGIEAKYRKAHLPYQGLDRFVDKGEGPIRPMGAPIGKLGLAICYDVFFPETARVLTLMGAELLAVLTNWAEGVEFYVDHLVQTRAVENRVNLIAANRVGEEGGFKFYGRSRIVDCSGKVLAEAGGDEEVIAAEVDLSEARNKRVVRIPGAWEVDCFKDRRPELYRVICAYLLKDRENRQVL